MQLKEPRSARVNLPWSAPRWSLARLRLWKLRKRDCTSSKGVRTIASYEEVSRMDELVKTLCDKTGLPEDKARTAADTVINFIKSKLPSSVSGQLDNALTGQGSGSITDRLGGILGKKAA